MDPELLESGRGRGRLCSARLRRSSRSEIWSSAALWISSARTRFSCSPGRLGRCCGCLDKGDSWDPHGSCEDGLGSSLGPLRILVLIREMGPMSESVCLTENSTTISLHNHTPTDTCRYGSTKWVEFPTSPLIPASGISCLFAEERLRMLRRYRRKMVIKTVTRTASTQILPMTLPMITPLGADSLESSEWVLVILEGVVTDPSCARPTAALNTSIADSCPHGTSEGTTGPVQFGEYQSLLEDLALLSRELYCKMLSSQRDSYGSRLWGLSPESRWIVQFLVQHQSFLSFWTNAHTEHEPATLSTLYESCARPRDRNDTFLARSKVLCQEIWAHYGVNHSYECDALNNKNLLTFDDNLIVTTDP